MKSHTRGYTQIIFFMILLLGVLSITSCTDPGMPDQLVGSIIISASIPTDIERSLPGNQTNGYNISYHLNGTGPHGFLLDRTSDTLPWLMYRIPVGNWEMTLSVLDADQDVILTGTKSIIIEPKHSMNVSFTLTTPSSSRKVSTPTINPEGGTFSGSQTVIISCPTAGAAIHYTLDASTPDKNSPLYESPLSLTANTTLKAIAIKEGMENSEVVQEVYTRQEQVATPIINPEGGTFSGSQTVMISCPTAGAAIHYTIDGSIPTTSSPLYSNTFTITTDTMVKAIAQKSGWEDSALAEATFSLLQEVSRPVMSPESGTYTSSQEVTISCSTQDAVIRYTTDGTTPTSFSLIYTQPILVTASQTVKAIAMKTGFATSIVSSSDYVLQTATPVFATPDISFSKSMLVTLNCATTGAIIYYTTDGSIPTSGSTPYTTAFSIGETTQVQAIARKTGWEPSAVATSIFTKYETANTPVISASVVAGGMQVSITSSTDSAAIYYTTDGSVPTASSIYYTVPFLVTHDTTIQAIATKPGMDASSVASSIISLSKVSNPIITTSDTTGGKLAIITSPTSGATIHYTTDGSTPTASSSIYTAPFILTSSQTVKAFAMKAGMTDSSVVTESVLVSQVTTPVISPTAVSGGQQVSISSGTSGATIHYTTDGSTPTASSTTYTAPFILTSSQTVKAIAVKSGMTDSSVVTESVLVSQVATPVISTTAVSGGQQVSISSGTSGATIHYTTDGSTPTASSTTYTDPFILTSSQTVKAFAVKLA